MVNSANKQTWLKSLWLRVWSCGLNWRRVGSSWAFNKCVAVRRLKRLQWSFCQDLLWRALVWPSGSYLQELWMLSWCKPLCRGTCHFCVHLFWFWANHSLSVGWLRSYKTIFRLMCYFCQSYITCFCDLPYAKRSLMASVKSSVQ